MKTNITLYSERLKAFLKKSNEQWLIMAIKYLHKLLSSLIEERNSRYPILSKHFPLDDFNENESGFPTDFNASSMNDNS